MTADPSGTDSPFKPKVDLGNHQAAARAEPDVTESVSVAEPSQTRSVAVVVLAVLAVLYSLYFARTFLIPIAFALLLDFLFSPAVRAMERFHIPAPMGALLIIAGLVGTITLGAYQLATPVQTWIEKAPQTLSTTQRKLRGLLRPIDKMTKTAEQVENAASSVGGGGAKTPEVVVRTPSVASRVLDSTRGVVFNVLEVLTLLYFLLAAGDLFLQKLIKVLPALRDKKKAVRIARDTESSISTYLVTTAITNMAEGAVVSLAMWLLGMPNPLLWGVLAAFFEFIPYLGAAGMTVILTIAALSTFDTVGQALMVPAAFLMINLIQGNVVSPLFLGHRLKLNPVALFVGLAFWYWIWGLPGAFIAVPLMATMKIFCDHIEMLAPVGEFLGMKEGKPDVERADAETGVGKRDSGTANHEPPAIIRTAGEGAAR
jgi:predicted PurR-regulated permease PerM